MSEKKIGKTVAITKVTATAAAKYNIRTVHCSIKKKKKQNTVIDKSSTELFILCLTRNHTMPHFTPNIPNNVFAKSHVCVSERERETLVKPNKNKSQSLIVYQTLFCCETKYKQQDISLSLWF